MNKSPEQMPESQLVGVYRQLPPTEPSASVDARILAHASRAVRQQRLGRPRWVWPLSAAAAIVVCAGVFFQIAQLIPRPTVVVMAPTDKAPEARALPAVGEESIAWSDRGTLTEDLPPQGLPQAWLERLERAMEAADTRRFETEYRRMRAAGIDSGLPANLRQWALQQGLDDLINDG